MVQFLQSFPYATPREIQAEALRVLEEIWDDYDVFVISAPTAFGKSAVAKSIMNACRSVSVITPTNLLVDQFIEEFPDTPTLHRLDSYWCDKWKRPCPITRSKLLQFCSEKRDGCKCRASADLSTAKYRRGPGIYNYYTYLSHKLQRSVLVVDEAHNLLPTIRERLALTIWQHDYKYPSNCYTPDQVRSWISTLPPNRRKNKKIQLLREAVSSGAPSYMYMRTTQPFAGKGTERGHPEERDCIRLLPVDISDAPPMFWHPEEVEKIVLMSATIGPRDIDQLGLGNRRIAYVDCASPIPAENRPIIPLDICGVSMATMSTAVPRMAQEIEKIAEHHSGERGVIHATYQISRMLQEILTGPRYIFHDKLNKKEKYQEFIRAGGDKILVACGLYEGMDLPGDLGRWQIITKIPWGSLGNPAVKWQFENDPGGYMWEAVKIVIQGTGRICRTETDYGVSYILDSTFRRMYTEGSQFLPSWWVDAINNREAE